MGLFALQPIYALVFVKSFDSLNRSWRDLVVMFWRVFKRRIYTEFDREKKDLQRKIVEIVNNLGEDVVENFRENRVVKEEDLNLSEPQPPIFDKERD